MRFVRWLCPVDEETESRITEEHWEDVRGEFKLHQGIAEFLCIVGLVAGFFLPLGVAPPIQVWDIAIGFGGSVMLPLFYLFIVCTLKGFGPAYARFSDYSTRKYAIPWRSQLTIYILIALVAMVAVFGRVVFPLSI